MYNLRSQTEKLEQILKNEKESGELKKEDGEDR
jgi:hypothetical protein